MAAQRKAPPEELVNEVESRETFIRFLEALAEDWEDEKRIEKVRPSPPYSSGALGWENGTIGAFLEAAAACGAATSDMGGIQPNANAWREAAEIILAGKYYE
jgi:hypothetical protein